MSKLGTSEVGLVWAKNHSPAPLMREVAAIAIARGWTLGDIKRRTKREHTSTVSGHFEAERPRGATLEEYQREFGIDSEHRDLVEGQGLAPSAIAQWSREVQRILNEPGFTSEAWPAASKAFSDDPHFERKVLERFALSNHRMRAGVYGDSGQNVRLLAHGWLAQRPVQDLYDALRPRLELLHHRVSPRRTDDVLRTIAQLLDGVGLGVEKRDAVIQVIRSMLVEIGVDLSGADLALLAYSMELNSRAIHHDSGGA